MDAAKKEGRITDYSNKFVGDVGIAVSRAFKQRYGIEVELITGRGAEFMERVKNEKRIGQLVGDMHDGSSLNTMLMKQAGLTVGFADELPALRDKDVWVADILAVDPKDKHIITFNFTSQNTWVNNNLVKPGQEPKTWKDLLDPKWKGKMLWDDDMISSTPYQVVVTLMREKVIDEDFLKALYSQDLRLYSGSYDGAAVLSRGDRSIVLTGSSLIFPRYIAEGSPIRATTLEDGTVLTPGTMVAYKGGPHPNATKVFINWLISKEGQEVHGRAASFNSIRKDVPDFLPEGARVTPKRPLVHTVEDLDQATKLFQARYLSKWSRK